MQNDKSKRIQQLRNDAADEDRSPKDRIKSAERLLSEFGPTGRNLPFINDVIRKFLKDPSYDNQLRAQKLKAKLINAQGLKDAAAVDLPEDPENATTEEAMPSIIAGVSASEVPKTLSISSDSLMAAFTETIGGYHWRQFNNDEIDLSAEQRQSVLEAVLGNVTVQSVQSLLAELYQPKNGWTLAGSFPAIVRIGRDYLRQHGVTFEPPPLDPQIQELLDMLNSKRAGV